jgi:hypothetical protein
LRIPFIDRDFLLDPAARFRFQTDPALAELAAGEISETIAATVVVNDSSLSLRMALRKAKLEGEIN